MRNKLVYILSLILITFGSCKKDVPENINYDSYPYNYKQYIAFVKGTVYDSLSGNIVPNAQIWSYVTIPTPGIPPDSSNQNGDYLMCYTWDNHHYSVDPDAYCEIIARTDSSFGYYLFKHGNLIDKDTIIINLYTLNNSHIKFHLKDTSSSISFKLNYKIKDWVTLFHGYDFQFNNSDTSLDTTFIIDAYPNRVAAIDWSSYQGGIETNETVEFFSQTKDTTEVEIKY